MVAAITHDLRQPLTAIEMNVAAALRLLEPREDGAALDAPRLGEALAALRDALAEQRRMREALQVLQDLAARREPSFRPLDLEASVRDVVKMVSSDAFARHILIDVQTRSSLPWISADEALVRQALLNVFIDALEATSQSGHNEKVIVVTLDAHDADAVDLVVTRFGRRREDATFGGWGLALARSVADAHGATLTMTGEPESGVAVTIRWPVRHGGIGAIS